MKDNKASVEGAVAVTKMLFGDDAAKIQAATDIANDCASITDANRCEAASKLAKCCQESHKARGIPYDW